MNPILTSITAKDNSELIKEVSKLYLKEGNKIADVTYGKGVFWKWTTPEFIEKNNLSIEVSDINGNKEFCIPKYDFRNLPYDCNYFDVVVFDPPYMHSSTGKIGVKESINKCYNNNLAQIKSHKDVIQLYEDGMKEAYRILKENGLLWVKCKDEIESGRQKWSHIEIYEIAKKIGFDSKDLFIFTQQGTPTMREQYQLHARKNHSYMWIFIKKLLI